MHAADEDAATRVLYLPARQAEQTEVPAVNTVYAPGAHDTDPECEVAERDIKAVAVAFAPTADAI